MSSPTQTLAPLATLAGKYLTVAVGGESYGIEIRQVREIIRYQKITPLPHLPAGVKGVINLRGRVIPITDLRVIFGVDAGVADRTCIAVVEVSQPGAAPLLRGLIVDRVEEVVTIAAGDLQAPPDFGTSVRVEYLLGVAQVRGEVKFLLDLGLVVGGSTAG